MLELAQEELTYHGRRLSVRFNGNLINISALARSLRVSQSYLSKVLAGKIAPNLTNARKIASALDMSLDEFLDAVESRKSLIS